MPFLSKSQKVNQCKNYSLLEKCFPIINAHIITNWSSSGTDQEQPLKDSIVLPKKKGREGMTGWGGRGENKREG